MSSKVTFLSSGNVYIARPANVDCSEGDTLSIARNDSLIAFVIVSAASSKSIVGKNISDSVAVKVGDTVLGFKKRAGENIPQITQPKHNKTDVAVSGNVLRGRIALQNNSVLNATNNNYSFHQPSAIINISLQRLANSFWNLSFYTNSQYTFSPNKTRFKNSSRSRTRLYNLFFEYANPNEALSYSFGRIQSKLALGLGAFDGVQMMYKMQEFTFGFSGGSQPNYKTSGIETINTRFSPFINYHFNATENFHYDGTLAYTKQMREGKLDREFLYLQNSFDASRLLNFYHSTEIDVNEMHSGKIEKKLHLTNTYLSIGSAPLDWLSLSAGYDATRNVYLFETNSSVADSLFDKTLQQGFRFSASVRLENGIALNGFSNIRLRENDTRKSINNGVGVFVSNIFSSQINSGVRISLLKGLYANAMTVGADVSRELFSGIHTTVKIEQYSYELLSTSETKHLTTVGADISALISSSLFLSGNIEKNFDVTANTIRIFFEIGYRF
ncbi:MAG: hypothetical protein AAB071_02990 [Bacteroidota bacterium]